MPNLTLAREPMEWGPIHPVSLVAVGDSVDRHGSVRAVFLKCTCIGTGHCTGRPDFTLAIGGQAQLAQALVEMGRCARHIWGLGFNGAIEEARTRSAPRQSGLVVVRNPRGISG